MRGPCRTRPSLLPSRMRVFVCGRRQERLGIALIEAMEPACRFVAAETATESRLDGVEGHPVPPRERSAARPWSGADRPALRPAQRGRPRDAGIFDWRSSSRGGARTSRHRERATIARDACGCARSAPSSARGVWIYTGGDARRAWTTRSQIASSSGARADRTPPRRDRKGRRARAASSSASDEARARSLGARAWPTRPTLKPGIAGLASTGRRGDLPDLSEPELLALQESSRHRVKIAYERQFYNDQVAA